MWEVSLGLLLQKANLGVERVVSDISHLASSLHVGQPACGCCPHGCLAGAPVQWCPTALLSVRDPRGCPRGCHVGSVPAKVESVGSRLLAS